MTTISEIPFARLVATDAINARAATKDGLDELAASIAAKGLIQPLAVRPADGDRYEVIDGRRRFQAIAKLVKAKSPGWSKTRMIPVLVRNEDDGAALETSLIANTQRLPMHAVDQYEVFARLAEGGAVPAEIAARFGLAERTVKQQMALGKLAPVVREAWKAGKIDADAAKAFAAHADTDVQAATFAKLKKQGHYGLNAYNVKRELTGDGRGVSVNASDELRLVGLDAYRAKGGTVSENLFDDDGGTIDDTALLATLAAAKMAEKAAAIKAHGWAWVISAEDAERAGFSEYDCDHVRGNDARDDIDAADYTPEERARSGVIIEMPSAHTKPAEIPPGMVIAHYGLLKPSDQMDIEQALTLGASDAHKHPRRSSGDDTEDCIVCEGTGTVELDGRTCEDCDGTGQVAIDTEGDLPSNTEMLAETAATDADTPPISAALLQDLTTAQTRAAQRVVAADQRLALRALIASQQVSAWATPVKVSISNVLDARGVTAKAEADFDKVLASTAGLTTPELIMILAPLIANGVNLLSSNAGSPRDDDMALVAAMNGEKYLHEMRAEFLLSDYFNRVQRAHILAALEEMREAGCTPGLAPVDALADMKRGEMAIDAAEYAAACGWLPPELRHPDYALSPGASGARSAPAQSAPPAAAKAATKIKVKS